MASQWDEDIKLGQTQENFYPFWCSEGLDHLGSNICPSEHFTTSEDSYEDCMKTYAKGVEV